MIFARRTRLPFRHTLRDLIWPRMGWRRTLRYFKLRFARLRDHPQIIARGVACGVSVCFVPLPFTHFIQAGILAWILRGNIWAAVLSTWVGTPWTYPPMWVISYDVGVWTFGQMGWEVPALPVHFGFHEFWHVVMTDPLPLMLPWIVGGYVVMVGAWFLVYAAVLPLIARSHRLRSERARKSV